MQCGEEAEAKRDSGQLGEATWARLGVLPPDATSAVFVPWLRSMLGFPTDRAIAFSLGQRERAEAALRAGISAES